MGKSSTQMVIFDHNPHVLPMWIIWENHGLNGGFSSFRRCGTWDNLCSWRDRSGFRTWTWGIYRCNTKPGPNMGDLYDIHNVICLNFWYDIIHINSLQFHFFWDEHSNLIYTKNRFGHRKETGTTQNLKSNCLSPNIAALVP